MRATFASVIDDIATHHFAPTLRDTIQAERTHSRNMNHERVGGEISPKALRIAAAGSHDTRLTYP